MSKVGENVRRLRIARGLTQEELANRVGYTSKSTINKIEQGVNELTQNKIEKFAEALSTSPSVLMGWVSEEQDRMNDLVARISIKLLKDSDLAAEIGAYISLDSEDRAVVVSLINALKNKKKYRRKKNDDITVIVHMVCISVVARRRPLSVFRKQFIYHIKQYNILGLT